MGAEDRVHAWGEGSGSAAHQTMVGGDVCCRLLHLARTRSHHMRGCTRAWSQSGCRHCQSPACICLTGAVLIARLCSLYAASYCCHSHTQCITCRTRAMLEQVITHVPLCSLHISSSCCRPFVPQDDQFAEARHHQALAAAAHASAPRFTPRSSTSWLAGGLGTLFRPLGRLFHKSHAGDDIEPCSGAVSASGPEEADGQFQVDSRMASAVAPSEIDTRRGGVDEEGFIISDK